MQSIAPDQQQLLIERDMMITLLVWETPLRNNDIGRVSATDFFQADGQPIQTCTGQVQSIKAAAKVDFQLT